MMLYNNFHSTSYPHGGGGSGSGFQGRGGSSSRGWGQKQQWSPDGNQSGSDRYQKHNHGGTPQQFGSQGSGRGGNANQRNGRGNFYENGTGLGNNQNHYQNQHQGQNQNGYNNGYNNRGHPSQDFSQSNGFSQRGRGHGQGGRGDFGGAGASHSGPQQNSQNRNNHFASSNGFQNSSNTPPNMAHGDLPSANHGNSGVRGGRGGRGGYGGHGGHGGRGNFSKANYFQNGQNGSQSDGTHNPFCTPLSAAHGAVSGLTYGNSGSRGSRGGGSHFSDVNNFPNNGGQGTQKPHWQSTPPRGGFNERWRGQGRGRGRGRGRGGWGGHHSIPSINPFHQPTQPGNLEAIDYDNYDADDSSGTDNEWLRAPPYQYGWPVINPLEQIVSSLDHILFQLINNTPQYRATIRRFMNGYTGPDDLEFWMNTLGVEYMNWEILHEVDRLGLQLPPGWNCVVREFEEQRMESNYSFQYLGGGGATGGINSQQPDHSYTNFRSERHGGTFATPAAAMFYSNPKPPPTAPRFALPGTQTAFSWDGQQQQQPPPQQLPTPDPRTMAPTMPLAMRQIQILPANTYRFGQMAC